MKKFYPIISIPKSGTHLVRELFIQAYPKKKLALRLAWWMWVDKSKILLGEDYGSEADRKANEAYLMHLPEWRTYFPDGKDKDVFVTPSHMMYDPSTAQYFDAYKDEIKPIFIYRDPRDVLVSFLRGMQTGKFGADPRVRKFLQRAHSVDEQYLTLLKHGIGNRDYGGFRGEVETWLKWRECQSILSVKYEDLMNNRMDIIEELAYHVGMKEQRMYDVLQKSKKVKTTTYRVAKLNQWKEAFSDRVKTMVKTAMGDIIVELGYAENDAW